MSFCFASVEHESQVMHILSCVPLRFGSKLHAALKLSVQRCAPWVPEVGTADPCTMSLGSQILTPWEKKALW
jgi:hypothetical protein